jgi:2-oxoglutarate dehydrogenase E1 component
MTPKSLLRHTLAAATLTELAEGTFHPVIDDTMSLAHARDIRRVVLCSGKVAIDLLSHERRASATDVAIVRVEMLYPFPEKELKKVLANYPRLEEISWVQEEPQNMGAWRYISSKLSALANFDAEISVVARPERSSPASGFMDLFMAEQVQLMADAFGTPIKEHGGKHVR